MESEGIQAMEIVIEPEAQNYKRSITFVAAMVMHRHAPEIIEKYISYRFIWSDILIFNDCHNVIKSESIVP